MAPLSPKQVKTMIENASHLELELIWIPKIIEKQTADEVEVEGTSHNNGVGLNAFDALFITKLYKQVRVGQHLDIWQAGKAKEKLMKYSGQYAAMTA